jgi:hypothetical protein
MGNVAFRATSAIRYRAEQLTESKILTENSIPGQTKSDKLMQYECANELFAYISY